MGKTNELKYTFQGHFCFVATLLIVLMAISISPILTRNARAETASDKAKQLSDFYEKADLWALKAIVLVSLSEIQHPTSVTGFKKAFTGSDRKLYIYAAEGLSRLKKPVLRSGVDRELLSKLIHNHLDEGHEYFTGKVFEIIKKATGRKFSNKDEVISWWSHNQKTYEPGRWTGGEGSIKTENSYDTGAMIAKLINLKAHGLDMVLVMDNTGSMGKYIDAARDGMKDLSVFMSALTPKFRLGLVTYRDKEELQINLTAKLGAVEKKLDEVKAGGGGDRKEAIAKGLEKTYKEMMWRRKSGKSVIVVGDAPPHKLDRCKKLAKKAWRNPAGKQGDGGPVSGGNRENKIVPVVTSCINVRDKGGGKKGGGKKPPRRPPRRRGGAGNDTKKSFKEIAKAGGGEYAGLKNRKKIVKQILKLSFRGNWGNQIDKFVDWTYKFKERGLW